MSKRYRRPKVEPGQIKAQIGKVEGEVDFAITYGDGVPKCDRALVFNVFGGRRARLDLSGLKIKYDQPFLDELEARGYDLDSLRFSIKKKAC